MCLLTNVPIAVPIPNETAETVVQAYLQDVYTTFAVSLTLITNNEKEFKNDFFLKVGNKLGIKHQFISSHYTQ